MPTGDAGLGEFLHVNGVGDTEALRNEAFDWQSQGLCLRTTEHLLGGGVEDDDVLLLIHGQDRVQGRVDQGFELRLALSQRGVGPRLLRAQTFFLQCAADGFRQPRQAIFQNVIRRPPLDALDRGDVAQCARDQDQRNVEPFPPQHIERVHPFPLRQVVVGDHHIRTLQAQLLLKLGFRLYHHHGKREAAFAQRLGYEFRVQFVIFNVQHSEFAGLSCEIVIVCHGPALPNAGNLPLPAADW